MTIRFIVGKSAYNTRLRSYHDASLKRGCINAWKPIVSLYHPVCSQVAGNFVSPWDGMSRDVDISGTTLAHVIIYRGSTRYE